MTTTNQTMNMGQTLRAVLGLKDESVIIATDSDWLLVIQAGNNDSEIPLKAAIPATCFEFGFKNKMKLSDFIKGKTTEAKLRVGEAFLHFQYTDNDLDIDYGRIVSGEDTIFDTRTVEKEKIPKFFMSIAAKIVSY